MYYKPYIGAINLGMSLNHYTMLWDGEWWACLKGGQGHLVYEGEPYEKICEAEFFGQEGTRVLGYVKITNIRDLGLFNYEFMFVKEEILAAYAFVNYEYKVLFDDVPYVRSSKRVLPDTK